MTVIEAIEITRDCAASNWHADDKEHQAMAIVAGLIAAYDALAPDWTQSPEWAQWCAIHANGLRYWFDVEPLAMHGATGWVNRGKQNSFDEEMQLPSGIAWTVCIWQRPEAQP